MNRCDSLRGCTVGVSALSSSPCDALERILGAGRDTTDLIPVVVAADEDFWFEVQQAFTEDRNFVNLNNGPVQNGLRIVQEAARRHSDFTGNAAWPSLKYSFSLSALRFSKGSTAIDACSITVVGLSTLGALISDSSHAAHLGDL